MAHTSHDISYYLFTTIIIATATMINVYSSFLRYINSSQINYFMNDETANQIWVAITNDYITSSPLN